MGASVSTTLDSKEILLSHHQYAKERLENSPLKLLRDNSKKPVGEARCGEVSGNISIGINDKLQLGDKL